MRYQKADSGEIYIHKNTTETSVDDYQCKIGEQKVVFSQNDMRALGRILIGDTDDFYLE
jgi:xanthine dehydrogenase molybdopterin-binding subunit B